MPIDEGNTELAKQRVGEVIDGRYKVLELLGEGGMGAVYVAEHLTLHKEVALKLIHASFAGNGDMRTRFAREALASARLDHPNVASAIDFGSLEDGTAYLVIQLVRGPSLDAVMGQGAIDWHRSAAIGAQIADALAAAHAQGIVHRDLKPDNVMLARRDDGSELVKVLDFGIARVPSDEENAPKGADTHRPLTKVGTVMGTPG
ncbi:MAG: serine/threonine protein kinase, partial [Polyangiaceae bacterium]|nr:serine/threonine protein kinase [Polyangiaceae bacterium]